MNMEPHISQALPSLRQLRCFLLAADSGSIGRAADDIGMSQPAASNAISRLEDLFGVSLLVRHAGGSATTRDGELLSVRTRRFFSLLAQGLSEACSDPVRCTKLLGAVRMVHVRALITIAESGNFTKAARQLLISGPALHRAAREFENLLHTPLFRPGPDGIGVNALGESLARQFRLAVREIVQAREEVGPHGQIAPAKVTLGILPLLPKRWIARAIAHSKINYPDVALELREGSYSALVQELRWGFLDFIIGALPPAPENPDITQESLFVDPYVLVVRREHPLARARKIEPKMLAAHDWVVPSPNLPRRAALERFFDTLPQRPRIWLDTRPIALH